MKISDFSFASSPLDDFFSPSSSKPKNVQPRIRVASVQDLNGFLKVAKSKLIHISTQDFWELGQDDNGDYFITRLADDTQGPIKE